MSDADAAGGGSVGFLLIHGNAGSGRSWSRVADRLAAACPGAPVVAPDLPGFGASPHAPPRGADARGVFAEYAAAAAPECDELVVGAYGLGCVAAIDAAHRLGPRVVRLVLSGPAGLPAGHGRNAAVARTAFGAAFLRRAGTTFARRRFLADQLADPAGDPEAARILVEDLRASRGFAALSHLHGAGALAGASSLACAVAVLWGDRDGVMPVTHAPDFMARMPGGASLRRLPAASHALHLERPDEVASALVAGGGGQR